MSSNYLKVVIGDFEVQVEKAEDLPVSINYSLEDTEDFQSKTSSNALNLEIPATLLNDKAANTFRNPDVEDMTTGQVFKGYQPCVIEANGSELLTGKAILTSGSHTNQPVAYNFNLYGNNADWMIDLAESTLYDFLSHINYPYTEDAIIASWDFDGTDETLPYVLAPVRYAQPMETGPDPLNISDYNMKSDYMKPSISKYFIIYWAFKSLGYKVKSPFLDSAYFRRQVMPWTWGSYLTSEGTILDSLKFEAQTIAPFTLLNNHYDDYIDVDVTNDYYNNMFDNSNTYSYNSSTKEMKWTYPLTSLHGLLTAFLYLNISMEAHGVTGSYIQGKMRWYKNGSATVLQETEFLKGPEVDTFQTFEDTFSSDVVPGDYITAKLYVYGTVSHDQPTKISVESFKLNYFRKEIGSTIYFNEYLGFKKYKVLDFLRGLVDEFNLSIQTDSVNKVVYIEPTHPYSLTNDLSNKSGGYFNEDFIDWDGKQDLSKKSVLNNFADGERELVFKYKDDSADGMHKKIKDRVLSDIPLGSCKYVLPERFKKGNKPVENRFFSPVMHYEVQQWRDITGTAPQMICLVPENVSNTSADEAQNTFMPKSAYYKGTTTDYGWSFNGDTTHPFPVMFAVNYKPGGENDPILSYSDERIGTEGSYVMGKGLVRRFFLQRMAVMRNGQYYNTFVRLNNYDISNFLHREHITCKLQRWELVQINGYKPLKEDSTAVFMRKWVPVSVADSNSVFPQSDTILTNTPSTSPFEIRYATRLCLPTDISRPV